MSDEPKAKAKTGQSASRSAGDTDREGARDPSTGDATLLGTEVIPEFGKALFGTQWQADFARTIHLSKSQITRILAKREEGVPSVRTRSISGTFPIALKEVVLTRILDLAALLDTPGMPYAGTPEMEDALAHIIKAAQILRGEVKVRPKK